MDWNKYPLVLTTKELREILAGMGENLFYEFIGREDFPKFRIGRKYYFVRDKVKEYLDII